jgi:uncharacterized protein (TIGR02266 family)
VRIEVTGIGAVDGRSEDVSEGGLFLVTRSRIESGAEVTIRFALPIDGRVISEAAIVKWARATRGEGGSEIGMPVALGVELIAPQPETRRQIERYVALMGDESRSRDD